MGETTTVLPTLAANGSARLPEVNVDSYNLELRDDEDFIGDRVTKGSFREFIENWRKPLRKYGDDPLGKTPSKDISRQKLDAFLTEGDPEAAGVVQGAIEDFAQEFALVIRRFLKTKGWRDTQRASRIGEVAIGRANVILKAEGVDIELVPVREDPDNAGLLGAAHLVPSWMFKGHDAILAVDIGGTNIRAGLIELNLRRAADLSKAAVHTIDLWRHGDDKPTRDEAVERLVKMLQKLIARAEKDKLQLTPFIGIGCPGIIAADGSIERGAQNLPGNWESSRFNLPARLHEDIPKIGDHHTAVLMHNDAVIQGLSEVPFMQDVERWGVLTIGTGLGNARFTNHARED
jgi:hypothetical protein